MADPVGATTTLSWLQIFITALSLPGIGGIGIGLWHLWLWKFGTGKGPGQPAVEVAKITAEEDKAKRTDARVEMLLERNDAIVKVKDETIMKVSYDRDRGWGLARHWYWLYRDLVPVARQAIAIAMGASRRLVAAGLMKEEDLPSFEIKLPPVPDLEQPIPRKDGGEAAT